jgi:hypothetical protein
MWLLGGNDGDFDSNGNSIGGPESDVWTSSDGITWVKQTANTEFLEQSGHEMLLHNNKLWAIGGGTQSLVQSDVWSSDDGIDWAQETDNAAFDVRYSEQVVSYGGSLILIGGSQFITYKNDVWTSADGKDWRKGYTATFHFLKN